MAAPPPPPPGPPPPPMGLFSANLGKSSSNAVDSRSALLQSIQKGAKLKKTTTVDKSGPAIAGRIANSNSSSNNNNSSTNLNAPSRPPPPTNINAQMPKLGGIFGGMTEMPKLKPVGARNNSKSPPSESPSSTSSMGSPQSTNHLSGSPAVGDFNAELTKHLTLKKQKKQQQQQQQESNSPNESRNRGPPPQPPTKNPLTTVTDNNIRTAAQSNVVKQTNSSSPVIPPNGTSIVPNKSSLFGKNETSNADSKASNKLNSNVMLSTQTSNSITVTVTNKIVPNHGKPNCAPKPPGIQNLIASKSPSNATTNNENSTRPNVARHHSMRSPRSPPITAPGPTFPTTQQQFGTIRGTPMAFKSQDAIHVASIRQAPSRPTVAPPRPPIEAAAAKNHVSPPPPPIRSVSNTNLSTLPLSVPSGISQNNTANNFGGSAGNVSTLLSAVPAANSGSGNIAPPLPPHRTCPPPPPTRQTSMTPASTNSGAPPVPQRHSSMRNSNPIGQTPIAASATTPKSTRTMNLTAVDLDAKFSHKFHNVTEFPAPQPFQNLKNGISIGM